MEMTTWSMTYDDVDVLTLVVGADRIRVHKQNGSVFTFDIVGDFLWTLDPDIAATMIAAVVVGLVLTTRIFFDGLHAMGTRAKVLLNIFRTLRCEIQIHSEEARRGIFSKGRTFSRCNYQQ